MFERIQAHLNDNCKDLIQNLKVSPPESLYPNSQFVFLMEGTICINEKKANISIAFNRLFPHSLPRIYLKDRKIFGFIPHVEPSGLICFMNEQGLVLDTNHPHHIVEESLKRAIKTLKEGIQGVNKTDLFDEFEIYWNRKKDCQGILSIVSPSKQIKSFEVIQANEGNLTFLIEERNEEQLLKMMSLLGNFNINDKPNCYNGIFVPLKNSIIPPDFDEDWSFNQIKKIIINNITSQNKIILNQFLNKQRNQFDSTIFVMLSIPRFSEGNSLIVFEFKNLAWKDNTKEKTRITNKLKSTMQKITCTSKINCFTVKRLYLEHLLPRTGGNILLTSKKIGIIGTGALGSRIAMELVRSGITNLTLIDMDIIDFDNIHRHELGANSILFENKSRTYYYPKVTALKNEIQRKYPHCIVNTIAKDVRKINLSSLQELDLIVIALGAPTIERYLNEKFHEFDSFPPTVYTWVEPLGIGGHVLVTLNNNKDGCYECLYTYDTDANAPLKNRASFAGSNQSFLKSLSGCGTSFTPYGSLDSLEIVVQCSKAVIAVLKGKETNNPLISYKGESEDFEIAGYKLSSRYTSFNQEQLNGMKYKYKALKCPVCNSR
ncbi:ThiF family adenylyltransferase [Bacillus thuringiensis]|uniref:ThiF family adenylyltransferase n=1 Tax=Bacillus thuringiensis TaxID=1428 RepID=UPI002D80A882|nr:E2/UBC family protein [Bacillus thuringiensis]MEB4818366.1 E2/UBC family protein [Bacillus thuringiensis]